MAWAPDLGTWGFYIGLAAFILAYPINVIANVTTPLLIDAFARLTKSSLQKRIAKLEAKLSEWEKNPATDEVQDHILWGFSSVKIVVFHAANSIGFLVFMAVRAVANTQSTAFAEFTGFIVLYVAGNAWQIFRLRREKSFRYTRSPVVRESLRNEINELKKLHDNWA